MRKHPLASTLLFLVITFPSLRVEAQRKAPESAAHKEAAVRRALGMAEPLVGTQEQEDIPPGEVRVFVIDAQNKAVASQKVRLAILKRGSSSPSTGPAGADRKQVFKTTNSEGVATFSSLDTGETQAYRVSVPYEGASYAANPFRLQPTSGMEVRIKRLPTTRSNKNIFQALGQTVLDFREGRLQVVQQARIVNFGDKTYTFPKKGFFIPLPRGASSFQSPETMAAQRIAAAPGGFRIRGQLAPGNTTLMWGYDLKYSGTKAEMVFPMAWPTFSYQVSVAATEGLEVSAENMPAPVRGEVRGEQRLITRIQLRPSDPPFKELKLRIQGIPGPGPGRYIAIGILGILLLLAFLIGPRFARERTTKVEAESENPQALGPQLGEQQNRILAELRGLQTQREAGKIGPKYYRENYERLRDDLASLLCSENTR